MMVRGSVSLPARCFLRVTSFSWCAIFLYKVLQDKVLRLILEVTHDTVIDRSSRWYK